MAWAKARTPFPEHLFQYLGLSLRRFYELAEPTWKMGIHFLWGPRRSFEYTFEPQLDVRIPELPRPNGYYCHDDFSYISQQSALVGIKNRFVLSRTEVAQSFPAGMRFI